MKRNGNLQSLAVVTSSEGALSQTDYSATGPSSAKKLFTMMALSLSVALVACSPAKPQMDIASAISAQETNGIIGGEEVTSADPIAQHIVQIYNIEEGALWCTGSIISENLIVTAAHCTVSDATKLAVGFGIIVPQNNEDLKKIILRRVAGGLVHPDWPLLNELKQKNWGDVAVLKIKGTIPNGYKPAALLAPSYKLKNRQSVVLAGYGMTNMQPQEFATTLRKVNVDIADANFSETEVKLDQRDNRGACHGDSGGPAYVKSGDKYALFGVTSRGEDDPKDTCRVYSIYSNLQGLMPFLQDAVAELTDPNFQPKPIPQP